MVQSKAATVEEYLEELPEERREVVSAVRDMVLAHLPEGYEETMRWGMISYEIPLSRYPVTYNKQPLGYVALAAQKNYYSLYVLSCYQDSDDEAWLREQFRKAGKKLDMGKCCVRFKRVEDLPLEAIGEVISRTPPETTIERYEESRKLTQKGK
jgi:hypothetical protein